MPLLDHFHPPLSPRRHWESFHVNWAGAIADALNESLLPEGYFAEELARLGPIVKVALAAGARQAPPGATARAQRRGRSPDRSGGNLHDRLPAPSAGILSAVPRWKVNSDRGMRPWRSGISSF